MEPALTAEARAARLARYYDLDTLDVSYDHELYLELAHEARGDVLELAVGSGRLAIPLALAGHRVVGVDHEPAMLARARSAWSASRGAVDEDRLVVHDADLAAFRTSDRFALAFIAVNTFLLAPDDPARLAILETMRRHLVPGGTAVVEISTPSRSVLRGYDGRLQHEWTRHDPEANETVTKLMSARHDPDAGTVTLTQLYEWTPRHGGALARTSQVDVLHLVEARHLEELAAQAGFGAVDLRGDYLTRPYGATSHRLILLARLV